MCTSGVQICTIIDTNKHKIMCVLLYNTGSDVKGEDSHISKFSFTKLSISRIPVTNKSKTQKPKVGKNFGQIFI